MYHADSAGLQIERFGREVETVRAYRVIMALWSLAPVRVAVRLSTFVLNAVSVRDLLYALHRTELRPSLIAIAWL